MSVKRKVASSAVEFDSKITKGIISGLSALDDIEGMMIEEENTTIINRPEPGAKDAAPKKKQTSGKAAKKIAPAAKSAPTEKLVKAPKAKEDFRSKKEYTGFEEAAVLSGSDDTRIEVSYYVEKVQLQKLRHLLQELGLETPEQVFNPGFGPHRQMVVPRISLRDYSELLAKGLELLYEASFALDSEKKTIKEMSAQEITDQLMS